MERPTSSGRWTRPGLILVLLTALLLLARFGLEPVLTLLRAIESLADAHLLAAMTAYWLSFVLLATIGLPVGTLYCLAGGYLFGLFGGAALALLGSLTSALITFVLAERHFGPGLRRRFEHGRMARLMDLLTRHATWYLVVLRIVPIAPFFAVNAAAGLIGIGRIHFMLATAAGLLPTVFIYSGLGNGLDSLLEADGIGGLDVLLAPRVGLPLLGLVLLIAIGWWYRQRALQQRQAPAGNR